MTKKTDASGLLPLKLMKMPDGSVKGVTPDGKEAIWPADYSNKPTRRHKAVMLNCWNWRPVWLDYASQPSNEDLMLQRLEAASAAFERYDFAGAEVNDASGWNTDQPLDLTRIAHTDAGRFNLHVRFEALTATVISVEAYDLSNGNIIGSMPANQKDSQA